MARTAYWVIDLSSYTAPTNAEIKAGQRTGGTAAAWSGNEPFAATSGSGTIQEATAVSGPIGGVSYRLSWTIYDDVAGDYPSSAPQHAIFVPQLVLQSDGSLAYKLAPSGGDRKLYLTTAGAIEAKTSAGGGDRRIALSGGAWTAT